MQLHDARGAVMPRATRTAAHQCPSRRSCLVAKPGAGITERSLSKCSACSTRHAFTCCPRWHLVRSGRNANFQTNAASGSGAPGVLNVFKVFKDDTANTKFLALSIGQTLSSIATLIHDSYLPVYVSEVLGMSNTKIGAVQGLAQFLCQLTKGVSGVVGDVVGSQARVLLVGMLFTLACKFMFPLLSTVNLVMGTSAALLWFFLAKLLDRMSKGIREAPTKAIMNELAKEAGEAPNAAYGMRQSLATTGAMMGSGIAAAVFGLTGQDYVLTFSLAVLPPLIAIVWVAKVFKAELFGRPKAPAVLAVPPADPGTIPSTSDISNPSSTTPASASDVGPLTPAPEAPKKLSLWEKAGILCRAFKPAYWQALAVVAVLYFARFDAAFLTLRAKTILPKVMLPTITLVVMATQAVLAAPLGKLSGTSTRTRNLILLAGFATMVGTNACFGLEQLANPGGIFVGAGLLGLHMALTHSISIAMVASYMPTGTVEGIGKLSGTAVSFTDLLLGFVLAASNALAGILSDMTLQSGLGSTGCFAGGAMACVLASLLLLLFAKFGDLEKDELVMKKQPRKAV